MYFEQFYLGCLAHASYMLASEGIAVVVDPQRDVDLYINEAANHGFTIRHIVETHLHADFVSGHHELALRTGADIHLGARAGATFPHIPVRDGDEIVFGRARIQFLETPGHTLESLSLLVTDSDRAAEPFAVLTGDTLFIGDVGRPDLSDTATPEQLAGMLYDSLHHKLLTLPDDVEVYPAHGAGSLCGRQISSEKRSTIGQQRRTNYACRPMPREEFISLVTADLPPRPEYFARDVELNRTGAVGLQELAPLPALSQAEVEQRIAAGAVILDTRPMIQFAAAHVPGSVHIALSGQFASWAGAVIGLDTDIVIVAEEPRAVEEARTRLARVGIERVVGYLADGIGGWRGELGNVVQIAAQDLRRLLGDGGVRVLDVRRPAEWQAGHIDGAIHIPLDVLRHSLAGLDQAGPLVVHCKGGYRSSIAASLLKRAGFGEVLNLTGGYDAWL